MYSIESLPGDELPEVVELEVAELLSRARPARALDLSARRARALARRTLFGAPDPLLRVNHYALLRALGSGAMGTVYEALDDNHDTRVALKLLHVDSPERVAHLKREVRALSELVHPNLVSIYEFAAHAESAYLAMELVEGADFVSHVRSGALPGQLPKDARRLGAAFAQLCAGVHALHGAGRLHRDIKPSNILVSADDSRVVLVDFGLAAELRDAAVEQRAGTLAYMSPEQRAGEGLDERSDWYSVGVVLYEALTGFLPAAGSAPPESRSPPPESRSVEESERCGAERLGFPGLRESAGEYADLIDLCARLLEPCRERRGSAPLAASARVERDAVFVGRAPELELLQHTLEQSRVSPRLVLLEGEAGMGKSALLRELIRRNERDALVLRGRCYEQETFSLKGFDSVLEGLSGRIAELAALLAPVHRRALARLAPRVLRELDWPVSAPARGDEAGNSSHDPEGRALRALAVDALRQLLVAVARRHPLIVAIDDFQWADRDSIELVASLLLGRSAAPIFVILATRRGTTYRALVDSSLGDEPDRERIVRLRLSPLDDEDSRALGVALLGASAVADPRSTAVADPRSTAVADPRSTAVADPRSTAGEQAGLLQRLAAHANGIPLLIHELAGELRRCSESPSREWFGARIGRLQGPERRAVELLAIAARPIPWEWVARCVELDRVSRRTLARLCNEKLVEVGANGEVGFAHDRHRELVAASLEAPQRIHLHRSLLVRLEEASSESAWWDPEALFVHAREAGEHEKVRRYAERAGDAAMERLAFARSAELYEASIHAHAGADIAPKLHAKHSLALERAGRGLAAARALLDAASRAPDPHARIDLQRRAAEQLFFHGRLDEGIEALRVAYRWAGLHWPQTQLTLGLSIAGNLASWARRHVWRFRPLALRPKPKADSLDDARLRVAESSGRLFLHCEPIRSVHSDVLYLRFAQGAAYEGAAARALAVLGVWESLHISSFVSRRGLRDIERAIANADRAGDRGASAECRALLAMAHGFRGHHREAIRVAESCEQEVRANSYATAELDSTLHCIATSLYFLGDLQASNRRWSAYAFEMRDRDDLHTRLLRTHIGHFLVRMFTSSDREALACSLDDDERWLAEMPTLCAFSWNTAMARIEFEIYAAGAAWTRAQALRESLAIGIPVLDDYGRLTLGRAALATAAHTSDDRKRSDLVRRARRISRRLVRYRDPLRHGGALLLEAGALCQDGQPTSADACLERARACFDNAEMRLYAAGVRRWQAAIRGDAAEFEQQRAVIAECGAACPDSWTRWFASGMTLP